MGRTVGLAGPVRSGIRQERGRRGLPYRASRGSKRRTFSRRLASVDLGFVGNPAGIRQTTGVGRLSGRGGAGDSPPSLSRSLWPPFRNSTALRSSVTHSDPSAAGERHKKRPFNLTEVDANSWESPLSILLPQKPSAPFSIRTRLRASSILEIILFRPQTTKRYF